jgi:hypothetical protein
VRICRSCSHFSSYIVCEELYYIHQRTVGEFSLTSQRLCGIRIIGQKSISGARDTRIAKEFGISSESTLLNNLQSIAKENRYQILDFPGTDPAQPIADHPGIERQSKRYPLDVSYPETRLAYSRLTGRILLSISSLSNGIQAQLRSTLLLRLMISDLTLHADSIQYPILESRNSLLTYDPTQGTPLKCVQPLCINLEWFILLYSKRISSCLNALNLQLPPHTESPSYRN